MFDEELGASRLEVRVGAEGAESLDERVVGGGGVCVCSGGGVVESGKDTRRALLLDEVTYDLGARRSKERVSGVSTKDAG